MRDQEIRDMGLPAFKMEVFEEARSALIEVPNFANNNITGVDKDGLAENPQITRDVNEYIASMEAWRVDAIKRAAIAMTELRTNYSILTVSHMQKLASRLDEIASDIQASNNAYNKLEQTVRRYLTAETVQISKYSPMMGGTYKREIKRLQKAFDIRTKTHAHNKARVLEAKAFLEGLIERESVPAPNFASDAERDAYVERSLNRAPDIEGTRARTLKLLAQFPKTAAYLAR